MKGYDPQENIVTDLGYGDIVVAAWWAFEPIAAREVIQTRYQWLEYKIVRAFHRPKRSEENTPNRAKRWRSLNGRRRPVTSDGHPLPIQYRTKKL